MHATLHRPTSSRTSAKLAEWGAHRPMLGARGCWGMLWGACCPPRLLQQCLHRHNYSPGFRRCHCGNLHRSTPRVVWRTGCCHSTSNLGGWGYKIWTKKGAKIKGGLMIRSAKAWKVDGDPGRRVILLIRAPLRYCKMHLTAWKWVVAEACKTDLVDQVAPGRVGECQILQGTNNVFVE